MTQTFVRWPSLVVVALLAVTSIVTRAQQSPRELFERARLLEENVRSLDRAVVLYEQVVAESKTDRSLAAEALLRVASVRQRQGRPEARTVLARIVREYNDQPAAASAARAKLAATQVQMVAGQVWTGTGVELSGRISTDGHFLTFVHQARGIENVAVHDLTTGEERLITHEDGSRIRRPVPSPDGKQIAYFRNGDTSPGEVRLIGIDGSRSRVLLRQPNLPVYAPVWWSPDSQRFAMVIGAPGDRRIVLVSVSDGSITQLKSTGWLPPALGGFSPDGRLLLYSVAPGNSRSTDDRGIFLIAVDGRKGEHALTRGPGIDSSPVWTPDGRDIIFNSDRSGRPALWALRIENGEPRGEPRLLLPDFHGVSIGFSRDGSYFYGTSRSETDAYVVGIDTDTLRITEKPTRLSDRFVGHTSAPAWSPDGRFIAYLREEGQSPEPALILRSTSDGSERTLGTRHARPPQWFPDSRSLLMVVPIVAPGRFAFRRIDVTTGEETVIFEGPYPAPYSPRLSPEGMSLFYWLQEPGGLSRLMRRDLETRVDKELYRIAKPGAGLLPLPVSPDGTHLSFVLNTAASLNEPPSTTVWTIPVDGGNAREFSKIEDGCRPLSAWASKGRPILGVCAGGPNRAHLAAFPADGGRPRMLDLVFEDVRDLSPSPDGRRLAFTGGQTSRELWTIRNLLPATGDSK